MAGEIEVISKLKRKGDNSRPIADSENIVGAERRYPTSADMMAEFQPGSEYFVPGAPAFVFNDPTQSNNGVWRVNPAATGLVKEQTNNPSVDYMSKAVYDPDNDGKIAPAQVSTDTANQFISAGEKATILTHTSSIGSLPSLLTNVKTSLVAAINEVKSLVTDNTSNIGSLPTLLTTAKGSLVTALNELFSSNANKLNIAAAQRSGLNLAFDKDAFYGTRTIPETGGAITFDLTGAQLGVTVELIHKAAVEPTYPATAKRMSASGNYKVGVNNFILFQYVDNTAVQYTIFQTA